MRAREAKPWQLRAAVAACATAVASFLLVQRNEWPPHEDETLALFVGSGSLGDLASTVLGERGGAPLHFVLAWLVAHLDGGLPELRLVSVAFAVGSVPVIAALVARVADRTISIAATALASASWVLLFHGVYGRMYSLFLFTSALSYLGLIHARERGGRWWAAWVAAALATVATHPYGLLVLASQALFTLLARHRLRESALAFTAVGVLGIPFWWADLVLAGRFGAGVGGGEQLGAPGPVLRYLGRVAGDFSAGFPWAVAIVAAAAVAGAVELARARRETAILAACVFGVPTLAFLAVGLSGSASPESRHLIFALPFFCTLVAAGLVRVLRHERLPGPVAVAAAALVLGVEVAWARDKTPDLFSGEPSARVLAREQAAGWLARTGRRDDVLLGYDPLYLAAWRRSATFSRTVVPRADATLAVNVLRDAPRPLGRGVWVFDAWDTNNGARRLRIPVRHPYPAHEFEARAFGPYLVIRSRARAVTPARYLTQTVHVQILGKALWIGDADVNYATARAAAKRFGVSP